jgi:hypothetical protein
VPPDPHVAPLKVFLHKQQILFYSSKHLGKTTEEATAGARCEIHVHIEFICKLSYLLNEQKVSCCAWDLGHHSEDSALVRLYVVIYKVLSVEIPNTFIAWIRLDCRSIWAHQR